MADIVLSTNQGIPATMRVRYADMGDGTHALVGAVALSGSNDIAVDGVAVPAAAPLIGQKVIAVTGTAIQLPAGVLPTSSVLIYALLDNTASGTVGGVGVTNTIDGTGNGYILEAGQSVVVMADNLSDVWINGTAGDIFTYSAG